MIDPNLTLDEEITKVERFIVKQGQQDFVDAMRASNVEQLDAKLLSLAKHRQDIRNTRDNDTELNHVKDQKRELEAPYREQLKMNEALTKFVALLLKEEE